MQEELEANPDSPNLSKIGRDVAVEVERYFETKVKSDTIRKQASRIHARTNVHPAKPAENSDTSVNLKKFEKPEKPAKPLFLFWLRCVGRSATIPSPLKRVPGGSPPLGVVKVFGHRRSVQHPIIIQYVNFYNCITNWYCIVSLICWQLSPLAFALPQSTAPELLKSETVLIKILPRLVAPPNAPAPFCLPCAP